MKHNTHIPQIPHLHHHTKSKPTLHTFSHRDSITSLSDGTLVSSQKQYVRNETNYDGVLLSFVDDSYAEQLRKQCLIDRCIEQKTAEKEYSLQQNSAKKHPTTVHTYRFMVDGEWYEEQMF
eukprot:Pgem_evm1s11169